MKSLLLALLITGSNSASEMLGSDNAEKHVRYLTSVELEGRMTMSNGIEKAAVYIENHFKKAGLKPLIGDSYRHYYDITVNSKPGEMNFASIRNGSDSVPLTLGKDYVPLVGSSHSKMLTAEVVYIGKLDPSKVGDVSGKVVAMIRDSGGDRNMTIGARGIALQKAGARGIITVGPGHKGVVELPKFTRGTGFARGNTLVGISMTTDSFKKNFGITNLEVSEPKQTALSVRMATELVPNVGKASNVIAVLPGTDPKLKDEYIVFGAHMDHLGYAETSSRSGIEDIHYGADDNASGSAGVVAMAEYFAKAGGNRRSIIFQTYSGEELGLLGARAWVRDNPEFVKKTYMMINMDMIGRLREEKLTAFCVGSGAPFNQIIDGLNVPGIKVNKVMSSPANSDHAAFIAAGVPSLFFNSGMHDEYHTERDTPETINYKGIADTLTFVKLLTKQLDSMNERIKFIGSAPASGAGETRPRRVRTGFIPDMGSDDARGMKISGVVGGSPAETAGVKAGDILTSFDGKPIKNIEALQQVLSTAKPDVEVEIIVIRGTETLKFKIKPAQGQAQFGFDPTYHPEFDDDHDHKHTDGEPL